MRVRNTRSIKTHTFHLPRGLEIWAPIVRLGWVGGYGCAVCIAWGRHDIKNKNGALK